MVAFVAGGGGGCDLRPLLLFAVALAGLAAPGCENVSRDFMPLEAGYSWRYRVESGGGTGAALVDSTFPAPSGVRRAEGGTLYGAEMIRVAEELDPLAPSGVRRFRVTESGSEAIWIKDGRTVLRSAPGSLMTVLQHPPFVGFGWTDSDAGGAPVFCKVVAREDVETPAGTFRNCVVVVREAEDLSSTVTQWFAGGVGIVRWRIERPGAPVVEWMLEEFGKGG